MGLLLDGQVTTVARGVLHQFGLVHQLWPFLEKKNLANMTHSLVTSRLEYCNALLKTIQRLEYCNSTIQKLQKVHSATAQMLLGKPRYHHCKSSFAGVTLASIGFASLIQGSGQSRSRLSKGLPCPTKLCGLQDLPAKAFSGSHLCQRPYWWEQWVFSVVVPQLCKSFPREVCLALILLAFHSTLKMEPFKQALYPLLVFFKLDVLGGFYYMTLPRRKGDIGAFQRQSYQPPACLGQKNQNQGLIDKELFLRLF